MDLLSTIKRARAVGVPLVAVSTQDVSACVAAIAQSVNGSAPVLEWDCVRGLRGRGQLGQSAVSGLLGGEDPVMLSARWDDALRLLGRLESGSVVLAHGAHTFLGEPAYWQGLLNLRDQFKSDNRMLLLLGPSFSLPVELLQDVVVLDEPLLDRDGLGAIVREVCMSAGIENPPVMRAVDALAGLSAFAAEQVTALSLSRSGLDVGMLWDRKRAQVSQTKGLTMAAGGPRFSDIGGIAALKGFSNRLFAGPGAPACVVHIDEIEKLLAGAGGDTSGVSQDALGVLLSSFEDCGWSGQILVGPPGCTKSYFAKSLSAEFGVPGLQLDLGAAKGSLVGQSEGLIRAATKTISAIGGAGVWVVATCNKLATVPPELRRRFRGGLWFCDLPDEIERAEIWRVSAARYGVEYFVESCVAMSGGWSGANIRDCCEIAWRLQVSVGEASSYLVPAALQDPEGIESLRRLAAGRFLSASYSGAYRNQSVVQSAAANTGRRISLGGE